LVFAAVTESTRVRGRRSAVGESRTFAMLAFTAGTQTTDAAFAPGMLAHLLPAVIWAQIWHQRVTDGGSSRIRALAPRRQPLRPGALPFLLRALVLLASLAMLPCTSAHGVAHPGGSLETIDCYSTYYSSGGVGACDTYGCTADDHTAGYGCCCSTLRLDPASHAGVFHYVYSASNCYKITVGTSIEQRYAAPSSPPGAVTATSDDQCRERWGSLLEGQNSLGSYVSTNTRLSHTQAGTAIATTVADVLQVCASSRADILLLQPPRWSLNTHRAFIHS
jgi:hypothetical protein